MTTKNTGTESGSGSNQQGGRGHKEHGKSGHAGQSGAQRKQMAEPSGERKVDTGGEISSKDKHHS